MEIVRAHVLVCGGTGCVSSGSHQVQEALHRELAKHKIEKEVRIVETGCHGFCEKGPLVIVYPEGTFYTQVQPEDVPVLVEEHLLKGRIVHRLLYTEPMTQKQVPGYKEIVFYKKQQRVVLRNCGYIDPERIEEYVARDGYAALAKVLGEMTPEQVIEEVKASGLRGRGGAGFSTGLKWSFCAKAAGDKKFIICNADEGDPGAFMDRSILEGDPHSVLEGMLIGAYAIGADEGYLYVRAEYPLAIKRLRIALEQAEAMGLMGENILGTGFNLHLHIKEGAGAFVCGEETALMASIEGYRGMPRPRPPFPAIRGLWEKPTNINNVETFSNIPHIIRNGASWFAAMGTEKSKGTKVFALTGKVKNTGLVEVPMGIPMREIVFDIGDGILDDKKFKAVQIGGPSGGCLPEEKMDLPVDYESLTGAGAIVGSGGLVVMDENTCMVDVAKYFLDFTRRESCGKCTPCREGTQRMREMLERFSKGQGSLADLDILANLAQTIKDTSLCGLGQTAPNPIITTLRYFHDEYVAHIKDKKCPAGVCQELLTYLILVDSCNGCTACVKVCPVDAISGEKKQPHIIDQQKCIKCGACLSKCRFDAIILQ
jgi:NADH:ubiquinone oxidoreductase subunit F (NADH-binding)/(2Fe-2S) ferredoxin/Pyruvate/2-oxoacid:ferredoxin oxidoreductase delta subunit